MPGTVITATSILGIGIDIPDIRSVIYLGRPRILLDYAQESRRAGRDRQPSEAIIIQPEDMNIGREVIPKWISEISMADYQQVVVYMESAVSEGCRRVVLDAYLDNHQRV